MDNNKELITQLIQETGCDREIASMLLKFTGWDFDGARRIIEAVPKDIFVIKCKFITQIAGNYGSFFFFVNCPQKNFPCSVIYSGRQNLLSFTKDLRSWQVFGVKDKNPQNQKSP